MTSSGAREEREDHALGLGPRGGAAPCELPVGLPQEQKRGRQRPGTEGTGDINTAEIGSLHLYQTCDLNQRGGIFLKDKVRGTMTSF